VLADAVAGRFPTPDGAVVIVPPALPDGLEVVVEFTGHALIATVLPEATIRAQAADGFGGVVAPGFLRWLAGPGGWVGSHDAVLARLGTGSGSSILEPSPDLDGHPRVRHARMRRIDVRTYGDGQGVVTIGRGVAGRWEVSVELLPGVDRSRGHGRRLIEQAVGLVPAGDPVFASVAPGNAASLRAFLACGFVPIGAEVILRPSR
jgi:hypothetical protein